MPEIFRRVEKKYIISKIQFEYIQDIMKDRMIEDSFGKSKICNIYFDTNNYDLISHSIQKPIYKDKIRLRSYNIPTNKDYIFLEIKRKFDGVVTKRRIKLRLEEVNKYFSREKIKTNDSQIQNEIDYYFEHYKLHPTMFLSYDRIAYYDKNDYNFRITFDSNIIARNYNLKLENGNEGQHIFEEDKYIMELKTLGAIPLWFVEILSKAKIYPCGFSKYGEAYTQIVLKSNCVKKYII